MKVGFQPSIVRIEVLTVEQAHKRCPRKAKMA